MKEQVKQIAILLGIIAVVVAGLVWLTNGKKPDAPSTAAEVKKNEDLTAKESAYDFGTISMSKGKVAKEFLLENKGVNTVLIGEVFTSCMCTEAELKTGDKTAGPFGMQGHGGGRKANLGVKPGETLTVNAIFDPSAHGPSGVGPIERQIIIFTGADKLPISLQFKAVVTP